MRLPGRPWIVAGSAALAVLAVASAVQITRAALTDPTAAGLRDDLAASASPTPSPSPSESPTPWVEPEASQEPEPSIVPGGPVPKIVPGRRMTELMFVNADPEYDAVFYVGDTRYGPFRPWTRTGFHTHETYAGMVFRLEFPKRPLCNDRNYPLERPLDGRWALLAQRIYLSRGCASLGVSGADPIWAVPSEEPWTPPPASPPPPSPAPATSAPSPTPSPTASASPSDS